MAEWTNDAETMVKFRVLMEQIQEPLDEWLLAIAPTFDDSPNSILLRLIGYGVAYYNKGLEDGMSAIEAYHFMMQRISSLPIAQQLFVMAGGDIMNRMAGVE